MTSSSSFISQQSQRLKDAVEDLCDSFSIKSPLSVCVASKYASVDQIRQLYNEGFRLFGENKIQAGIQKIQHLEALDIEWHFIGHLQKNKVRKALEHFHVIQSVDSVALLQKINDVSESMNKTTTCYLQLNAGYDPKKFGLLPEDFIKEKEMFFSFPNIDLKGIMIIAPYLDDERKLKEIFDFSYNIFEMTFKNITNSQLSMGMSQDYHVAIPAGATMIRIGRMLFEQQ